MTVRRISKMAIITALYVALTFLFFFASYGEIQFRIAEVLMLLVFYRKGYAIPLVLGCAIANAFSPLGIIDVGFGTLGTVVAVLGIMLVSHFRKWFKKEWIALFVASLFPVLANGFLVGFEISFIYDTPYWFNVLTVGIGEFAVVSVFGVTLYALLGKNKTFMKMIVSDQPIKNYDGENE